jgi:hypothetical protein
MSFRIVGVVTGGAVADLAGQRAVERPVLGFALLVVALDTDLPARVLDVLSADGLQRGGTIVSQLAERFWYKAGAGHDQYRYGQDKQDGQTNDLVR